MNQNIQNQTLETAQLANRTPNVMSLNPPQTYQPNITANPINQPQISPAFNNQIHPVYNQKIEVNPTIKVEQKFDKFEHKVTRTYTNRFVDLGPKSVRMICPFCNEDGDTQIKKTRNMKAFCTAIWTCYCGFACIQMCRNKEISCDDVEHYCQNCGHLIGKYHVM